MLTRFSPGGIRELATLFFPLFLSMISSGLMLFFDRLFLARHSLDALNGVAVAGTLALFFQVICSRTLMINQVYVAENYGRNRFHLVGPVTWQMIWAAALSFFLTVPVGLIVSPLYFAKTEVAALGSQYFFILMLGNFLFPLGAVLSTFQIGLGRTKILILVTCIANVANIFFDYVFILKLSYGVKGAAVATLLSQGLLCAFLFTLFLASANRLKFSSQRYRFIPSLFGEMIRTGIYKGISHGMNALTWSICALIVSLAGKEHLLALSFGSSIWFLLSTFVHSLGQGLLTQLSYYFGKDAKDLFWQSFRSSLKILSIASVLLAIPLGFFSHGLIPCILSYTPSPKEMGILDVSCKGLLGFFLVFGMNHFTSITVTAVRETLYILKVTLFGTTLATLLPFYVGFYIFHWGPDKVWFANWLCCVLPTAFYFFKINRYRKQLPSERITIL